MDVPGQVLAEVLRRFGLDESVAHPVAHDGAPDGAVWRVQSGATVRYAKIRPPDGPAPGSVEARLRLAEHLAARAVRTTVPVRTVAGDLVALVACDGSQYTASVTEELVGRPVGAREALRPSFARRWGRTLAAVHDAAQDADESGLPSWREEFEHFDGRCRDESLSRVWRELGAALAQRAPAAPWFGVVHNDLHSGNLVVGPDRRLGVLDLDVACRHWLLLDVAIALVHPVWELRRTAPHTVRDFVEAWLGGYASVRPLPPGWYDDLDVFMRYRMALLTIAVLDEGPCPPWLVPIRQHVLAREAFVDEQVLRGIAVESETVSH